jgi:hypothetical protein
MTGTDRQGEVMTPHPAAVAILDQAAVDLEFQRALSGVRATSSRPKYIFPSPMIRDAGS